MDVDGYNSFIDNLAESSWTQILPKPKREFREKPLSYADVIKLQPSELKILKITKGSTLSPQTTDHILFLNPKTKTTKMTNDAFILDKSLRYPLRYLSIRYRLLNPVVY